MRKSLFFIALISMGCACNRNDIKIIRSDAGIPGVTAGVPWTEITYLVAIPRYDRAADAETTDVVPGLRLDGNRVLTEAAYVHAPRKSMLVVRSLGGGSPTEAAVIREHLEDFSVLRTASSLPGPNPLFARRFPHVGEDVRVGPHAARVFSVSLHGERYRRFTLVFLRDAPERTDFPYPCVPGLPVLDADDHVLGVTAKYGESVRLPPIGFDHGQCKVLSSPELLDLLKWVE